MFGFGEKEQPQQQQQQQFRNTADPAKMYRTQNGVVIELDADWYSEYRGDLDELFSIIGKYKSQTESGYKQGETNNEVFSQRIQLTEEQLPLFMEQLKQAKNVPLTFQDGGNALPPLVRGMD